MEIKDFFTRKQPPQLRQLKALNAIYEEGLSFKEAAEKYRISLSYLKKIDARTRALLAQGKIPFLQPISRGPKKGSRLSAELRDEITSLRKKNFSVKDIQAHLARKGEKVSISAIDLLLKEEGFPPLHRRTKEEKNQILTPPKIQAPHSKTLCIHNESFYTHIGASALIFLPLIESLGIVPAIKEVDFPRSSKISAVSSILSLLALKLIGNERYSHDAYYGMDRALGLFAGLNVLPKNTFLSSYSYIVERKQNYRFLSNMKQMFHNPDKSHQEFNLDFKAIPYWGDKADLERNWSGMQRRSIKSLLAFLAQDPDTGMLVYSNAGIRHSHEKDTILEFIDFWKQGHGQSPRMLIFDSKLTTYAHLNRLNQLDIGFITLRRRGKELVANIRYIPEAEWNFVKIEGRRKYPRIRVHDSMIKLRNYEGPIRQIIITNHGRQAPTFLITNDTKMSVEKIVKKYARRWLIEQEIAEQIGFFHLNSPSSSIVVKVDLDLTLSLLSHNLYKMLTDHLPGFEKSTVATVNKKILQGAAKIHIQDRSIVVDYDKKAYLPTLFEVPWLRKKTRLSWMDSTIEFRCSSMQRLRYK